MRTQIGGDWSDRVLDFPSPRLVSPRHIIQLSVPSIKFGVYNTVFVDRWARIWSGFSQREPGRLTRTTARRRRHKPVSVNPPYRPRPSPCTTSPRALKASPVGGDRVCSHVLWTLPFFYPFKNGLSEFPWCCSRMRFKCVEKVRCRWQKRRLLTVRVNEASRTVHGDWPLVTINQCQFNSQ